MVKMVQVSKNRWEIQTKLGYVLKSDITVSNVFQAENYVKNYVSSYRCWDYEVVPMLSKGVQNAH